MEAWTIAGKLIPAMSTAMVLPANAERGDDLVVTLSAAMRVIPAPIVPAAAIHDAAGHRHGNPQNKQWYKQSTHGDSRGLEIAPPSATLAAPLAQLKA
jgi:hypothetical protein